MAVKPYCLKEREPQRATFCSCGSNVPQSAVNKMCNLLKCRHLTPERIAVSGSIDWGSTPHGRTSLFDRYSYKTLLASDCGRRQSFVKS